MLPPVPAAVDTATVPTVAVFDAATRDIYSEMLKQAYGKSLTKIFKSQHQGMPGNYDYLLLKPSKSKEEAD